MRVRTSLGAATALVVALVLSACGSSTSGSSGASIAAKDPWVKSAPSGMTAAFVVLTNDTDTADVLESVSTPAAGMVQLHEMAMKDGQMVMQEKKGGIEVPAHGTATLEPGGNHIMLMELTGPVKAGDSVALTLTFKSGATLAVTAVAKDYDGAKESYAPSPSGSMSGM